jgi:ribose 5-phosphate isomerase B
MKIYIGSDHAGYNLKETLQQHLKDGGHEVLDIGTFDAVNKVDYPDLAREVAEKVQENEGSRGVLVCGSGIGVSIVANKIRGIRAVNAHDANEAKLSREHNDANVITFGERTMDPKIVLESLDAFLAAQFEGGRHEARVQKIKDLENK